MCGFLSRFLYTSTALVIPLQLDMGVSVYQYCTGDTASAQCVGCCTGDTASAQHVGYCTPVLYWQYHFSSMLFMYTSAALVIPLQLDMTVTVHQYCTGDTASAQHVRFCTPVLHW